MNDSRDLEHFHDGMCPANIGDGACACLVDTVERLQAENAKLRAEVEEKACLLETALLDVAMLTGMRDSALGAYKRSEAKATELAKLLQAAELQNRAKDEEIASLKESLLDVLEISEIEGSPSLTVLESAKIAAARTLLGPESRFAVKQKPEHQGGISPHGLTGT